MDREHAWDRINRVIRPDEIILAFVDGTALPYEDSSLRLMSGRDTAPIWVAVTPARLIEVGSNGALRSTLWGDVGGLAVVKKKKRWQYSMQHRSQSVPYSPIAVTPEFAKVLADIQGGVISLSLLPEAHTTYSQIQVPRGFSALDNIAVKMGINPDIQLVCDACGERVGTDTPYTQSCRSCHRILDSAHSHTDRQGT